MAVDDDPYFSTLESVMRVSLAGFGGALAGLSFARRGAAARQVASHLSKVKTPSQLGTKKPRLQKQRPIIRSMPPTTTPYVDRELPTAWAVACMSFAGIVEVTRKISPTTFMWELIHHFEDESESETEKIKDCDTKAANNEQLDPSVANISDYIIGGIFAGALFKGSAVRTKTGARIDASIMGGTKSSSSNLNAIKKGRPLSGILPGAALGLLAGVSIIALEHAQALVEEAFGQSLPNSELIEQHTNDTTIPDDIKQMTNEELASAIEELKRGNREKVQATDTSHPKAVNEVKVDEREVVPDLISELGFRPHIS